MPNPRNNELRFDTFQSAPKKTAKGYEILCIHTGQSNGWNFKADVLQESVKFFESIECFTDHNMFGESVHDLAGVLSNPRWDDNQQGIVAGLLPTGPSAELLRANVDEMLSENDPHPNMGFSPVLIFTSDDKDVKNILRVRSVDMVINPAFRTKFIAEKFNQRRGAVIDPANTRRGVVLSPPIRRTIKCPTPPPTQIQTPSAPVDVEIQEHLQAKNEIIGAQLEINASIQGDKDMHNGAAISIPHIILRYSFVSIVLKKTGISPSFFPADRVNN